jgi:hypothetical protein
VSESQSDDLKLLREIVDSDGRKYTGGAVDRRRYERLIGLGWLSSFSPNLSDVVYEVTEQGKVAAGSSRSR